MPQVTIGPNCRLQRVVIDRGCTVPEGLVVGEDPDDDAERFFRTESGVTLITRDALQRLEQR